MPSVLGVGLVFIHKPSAVFIGQYPCHRDICFFLCWNPIRVALHAHAERIIWIRMAEAISTVVVPHMPQIRADIGCHLYTIASITLVSCGEYRVDLPKLPLHLRRCFETTTGEDDAFSGLN